MQFPYPTAACLAIALAALAATPLSQKRLTTQRVAELTAAAEGEAPKAWKVEIAGLGAATLPAAKPMGSIEAGKALRYPTEFDPPQAAANGAPVLTPTTPAAFDTIDTGWTIRLSARPNGKLVGIYGVADYVESQQVNGGYGAIAGPVYNRKGEVITPNKLDQPRVQTTSTHFHIFAIPGESYEVILYRGAKAEKRLVTITAE